LSQHYRDMEPSRGCGLRSPFSNDSAIIISVDDNATLLFPAMMDPYTIDAIMSLQYKCLRNRGGTPGGQAMYTNQDTKFNDIPYLTNMRFMWNGIPCVDFHIKVVFPLNNGLGSITVGDDTLLDCGQFKDSGGVLGTPSTAVARVMANDSIYRNHLLRKKKLFHCLLNYINSNSRFYLVLMRHFKSDGPAAYQAILAYGQIRLPPRINRAREDTWNQMDMEKLRIPCTMDGLFRWADAVQEQAFVLGKDGEAQLEKFTSGLPAFFNVDAANMAKDTSDASIQYPATYGAMPIFAFAPNAADPHPMAGYVDLQLLVRKYLNQWAKKIATLHRNAPSGMLKSAEPVMEDAYLDMLAKDITPKTKCYTCGGDKHTSTQFLEDGTKVTCAKKIIEEHNQKVVKMVDEAADDESKVFDVTELQETIQLLQDHAISTKQEIESLQDALSTQGAQKKQFRLKRRTSPSRQQNTYMLGDNDDVSEEGEQDALEDDSSEASTHSTISHQSLFANSSMPMKPKETFRRRPSFKRQ
jgi:hypothetical protein